jgi:hypothetical protein
VLEICRIIREKTPGARLIVMAVFPRAESLGNPKLQDIAALDRRLALALASQAGTTFLDLTADMLGKEWSSATRPVRPTGNPATCAGLGIPSASTPAEDSRWRMGVVHHLPIARRTLGNHFTERVGHSPWPLFEPLGEGQPEIEHRPFSLVWNSGVTGTRDCKAGVATARA